MISACETEDGVVFDMSELEADALRSYADGLVADPKHPFVELLRSQGLVVGDTPVPHLAVLLDSAVVSRCDEGGLYAGEDDLLSVWAIDSAQLRETFFELSALGEPSGDGIVSTAVPEVLFDVLERGDATEILVEVPKVAREIADVIDTDVDEVTGAFWADVADDSWVGLAVRVIDVVSYPDLSGDSWRLIGTSEEVCEVLAGVEFTELYPDEVPLLADEDGEFWAAVASSSPEVLWEDIEDVLAE